MIRILIVDDQKVVREKLRYMLDEAEDIKVVGIATDGNVALEQISLLQPDVVLIDIEMPNLDGITATQIISQKFPQIKVMVLSTFDSEEFVNKSIDAGAKGYLLKTLSAQELHDSVRFIARGYSQLIGPGLKRQKATANANGSRAIQSPQSTSSKNRNLRLDKSNTGLNLKQRSQLDPSKVALVKQNNLAPQPQSHKINWKKWLTLWAAVNLGAWALTVLYLKSRPAVYTSEWSLILPGEAKVDLSLPRVGKANLSVDNSVKDLDPRNNILYLASSPSVLSKAAEIVGISTDDFNEPEIEVVDDSSIISFSIDGDSPEEARSKGFALHQSMLEQIQFLKKDNSKQQTEDFRSQIQSEQTRLQELQQRLNQRKISSDLIGPNKVADIANRVENLRQQKKQVERELQETNSSIRSLSSSLRLSPAQAQDALALQKDRLFQQYLQRYNSTNSNLVALQAKFTDSAPAVLNEKEALQQIETALLERGRLILGQPLAISDLEQLNVKSSSENKDLETLATQLVTAKQRQENLTVREQTLDRQIAELNDNLKNLAQEQLPLENLQREAEFAEAVLTSKIARSGIQDNSANFPVVQLLSEPDLPGEPSNSITTASLVSMGAFSLLSLTGLMMVLNEKTNNTWQEEPDYYLNEKNSEIN